MRGIEPHAPMLRRTGYRARWRARFSLSKVGSAVEDVYAFAIGCTLIAVGLALLHAAGLVTGGIAGLALLFSYVWPLPSGTLFVLINLPFFAFAGISMGKRFLWRTVIVNLGIMLISTLTHHALPLTRVDPAFAAIVGGSLTGTGILAIARHGAGVGGTGVITLWLQRTRGTNAGRSQCMIDVVILSLSSVIISPISLAWSALSAVAMSAVLITWYRPTSRPGQ